MTNERYKIHEYHVSETHVWTVQEILKRINSRRNPEWIDYDETDWLEGWMEWEEGDTFHLVGKWTGAAEPVKLVDGRNKL